MAMQFAPFSARQFADAMLALLPPGQAWDWPQGGDGDALMLAMGEELVRVSQSAQGVMDAVIEWHRPGVSGWNISDYRRVAEEAMVSVVEGQRRPLRVGSSVGGRCWSDAVNNPASQAATMAVPLFRLEHLLMPLRVGSAAGDRMWSAAGRFMLRVFYFRSVVDPRLLFDALEVFRQAHVVLFFVDITGRGGEVNFGQD